MRTGVAPFDWLTVYVLLIALNPDKPLYIS